MTAALWVLVIASVIAAVGDLRTRRIPNLLTATLAVAALALHVPFGLAAVGDSALAMLLVFLAGLLAFRAGWFGGGDVKLLAACAGLVGTRGALSLLLAVFICGGILTVADALRRKRLAALLRSTAAAAAGVAPAQRVHVPFGVAIAAGSIAYSVPLLIASR